MADFYSYFSSFLPSSWVHESGTTRPGVSTSANEPNPARASSKANGSRVFGAAFVAASVSYGGAVAELDVRIVRGDLPAGVFHAQLAVPEALKSEMVDPGHWGNLLAKMRSMDSVKSVYIPEILE